MAVRSLYMVRAFLYAPDSDGYFRLPGQISSFVDELVTAARGSLALLMGDRRAPDYFDFSQRGVIGSFIALLGIMVIEAVVPMLLGATPRPGSVTRAMVSTGILYAGQLGASAAVLRQLSRSDGFWPYVVCLNWVSAFLAAITLVLLVMRIDSSVMFIAAILIGLAIQINIARLVVTLKPGQIVLLLVAQFAATLACILVIGALFPLSPEEAAQLQRSFQ